MKSNSEQISESNSQYVRNKIIVNLKLHPKDFWYTFIICILDGIWKIPVFLLVFLLILFKYEAQSLHFIGRREE